MNNYRRLRYILAFSIASLATASCDTQPGQSVSSISPSANYQNGGSAEQAQKDQPNQDQPKQDDPRQDAPKGDTGGPTDPGDPADPSNPGDPGSGTGDGDGDDTGNGGDNGGGDASVNRAVSGQFKSINPLLNLANIGGQVSISEASPNVTVNVNPTGLPPATMQMQHLHTGTSCPTMAADTNNDGWVDAVEEAAVSGKILVPFDADLTKQIDAGDPMMGYPTTDANGAYSYSKSGALIPMLQDLRARDPNPNDSIVKLERLGDLRTSSRVVIIHGVPAATALPATVRSIDGLPPHQTLPVACAELSEGETDTPVPQPVPQPVPEPAPSPVPAPPPGAEPAPGTPQ